MPKPWLALACLSLLALLTACATHGPGPRPHGRARFTPLFPTDGQPSGWVVRNWANVAQEPPPGAAWTVTQGVLSAGSPRGTWLISEREYQDFVMECEFRLGERGNAGFAFRFPPVGDPSVTGFEVQWVDPRFYGTNYTPRAGELSGAISYALAPTKNPYRPGQWNRCLVSCIGTRLIVELNGQAVIRTDLNAQTHAPTQGRALAQRPHRGRIGFQDVGRGAGRLEIRNARLRALEPAPAR